MNSTFNVPPKVRATIIAICLLVFALPTINSQTVTDIDGNVYETIEIGNQVWMKENLRVTKYNDGTPILRVDNAMQWYQLDTAAYSWYNGDSVSNYIPYGALYNGFVETDRICPTNWHVPNNSDWDTLIEYVKPSPEWGSAAMMKPGYWPSVPTASNSSGFSALAEGGRGSSGGYYGRETYSLFWSADEYVRPGIIASKYYLHLTGGWYDGRLSNTPYNSGLAIRCVQDELPEPMNGVYTICDTGDYDFVDLVMAFDSLKYRGADGDIIFNILPGIYQVDELLLDTIPYWSNDYTLRLIGLGADNSQVVLLNSSDYGLCIKNIPKLFIANISMESDSAIVPGPYDWETFAYMNSKGGTKLEIESCKISGFWNPTFYLEPGNDTDTINILNSSITDIFCEGENLNQLNLQGSMLHELLIRSNHVKYVQIAQSELTFMDVISDGNVGNVIIDSITGLKRLSISCAKANDINYNQISFDKYVFTYSGFSLITDKMSNITIKNCALESYVGSENYFKLLGREKIENVDIFNTSVHKGRGVLIQSDTISTVTINKLITDSTEYGVRFQSDDYVEEIYFDNCRIQCKEIGIDVNYRLLKETSINTFEIFNSTIQSDFMGVYLDSKSLNKFQMEHDSIFAKEDGVRLEVSAPQESSLWYSYLHTGGRCFVYLADTMLHSTSIANNTLITNKNGMSRSCAIEITNSSVGGHVDISGNNIVLENSGYGEGLNLKFTGKIEIANNTFSSQSRIDVGIVHRNVPIIKVLNAHPGYQFVIRDNKFSGFSKSITSNTILKEFEIASNKFHGIEDIGVELLSSGVTITNGQKQNIDISANDFFSERANYQVSLQIKNMPSTNLNAFNNLFRGKVSGAIHAENLNKVHFLHNSISSVNALPDGEINSILNFSLVDTIIIKNNVLYNGNSDIYSMSFIDTTGIPKIRLGSNLYNLPSETIPFGQFYFQGLGHQSYSSSDWFWGAEAAGSKYSSVMSVGKAYFLDSINNLRLPCDTIRPVNVNPEFSPEVDYFGALLSKTALPGAIQNKSEYFTVDEELVNICKGSGFQLHASHPEADRYLWSTGESTETITVDIGDYYTVESMIGCKHYLASFMVQDDDHVTEDLKVLDTVLCSSDSVLLSAKINDAVYFWSTGSAENHIAISDTGTYFLYASKNCTGHQYQYNVSNPIPEADFSAEANLRKVSFTNYSENASSYYWDLGDFNSSWLEDLEHTYLKDGEYQVSLVAVNNCGTDTLTKLVKVEGLPEYCNNSPFKAFYSFSTEGLQVSFTPDIVDAEAYMWDFGDGKQSSAVKPEHIFNSEGSYQVTLVVEDECGTDTLSQVVTLATTGFVDEVQLLENVYPNPANAFDIIRIEAKRGTMVSLYNVQGELIYEEEMLSSDMISIQGLPAGTYILQFKSKEEINTHRLVVK